MMKSKQELLISLLENRCRAAKVGILVKSVSDIVPDEAVKKLAELLNKRLHAAIVGYDILESSTGQVIITAHIENAVRWRSDPEYAGSIIAFVRGDSEKLHSLAEFDIVTTRDLSEQLLEECIIQQTNTPTQNFWKALKSTAAHHSFEILYEFVKHVSLDDSVVDAIPKNMWRLDLLCDYAILNTNIKPEERLSKNRELITAIGQMSEEHRRKLSRALVQADKDEKNRLQAAYRELQDFFKYGRRDTLSRLDFATVEQLFTAAKAKKTKAKHQDNEGEGEATPTVLRGKQLEEKIAELVVAPCDNEDEEALGELLGELKKHFDDSCEENKAGISSVGGSFGNSQIELDNHRTPLRKLVGVACNEDNWGGVMATDEAVLRDAIAADMTDFMPFSPMMDRSSTSFDGSCLFTFIRRFDEQFAFQELENVDSFSPILDKLVQHREELLRSLDLVMFYPILSFGVDEELRQALVGYVESWMALLRAYCRNEAVMHGISQKGSNFVARAILLLDVLYIKTPTEWKGMLMPLHPLYLWRYYEVFRELKSKREEMSGADADSLAKVLSSLPQMVNFLVVDKMVTNDISTELPCSGSIDMLPTFENKTNRYLGYDGIEAVDEVLSRWLAFTPYTHNEIRICTVDAPDIAYVLKSLRAFIEKSGCKRIIYNIYLTRNQNGNSELAKLDYDSKDYEIGEMIKSRRLCISIKNVSSLQEIKCELHHKPVHVAFYFDQSAYSIEYGPSTKHLYVSPLVITYDYEFDDITHRGEIFPSSDMDSGMIGDYHKVMRFADIVTANRTPRPTYNPDADISALTSTITDQETLWLVAADRSTSNYLPAHTIPIGEKHYGQRMVSIWASKDSRIIEQYMRLLRRYNLHPEKEALIDILTQFGHISSEGLISIPRFGADSTSIDNRRKGLIGTVFAAAWYSKQYPNSLVASLDTHDARLWLNNGSFGNERADLIGLRFDEGSNTLHLQPIEVKTRDESPDASVVINEATGEKHIVGHAADQIATVICMLKEMFGLVESDTLNMFVAARKEVLKYQIVSECFRHIHDANWQKQWSIRLRKAFGNVQSSDINIEISGLLLHIKLSETGDGGSIEGSNPDFNNCRIELIELTSKEIQAHILGGDIPARQTWTMIDYDETEPTGESTDNPNIDDEAININAENADAALVGDTTPTESTDNNTISTGGSTTLDQNNPVVEPTPITSSSASVTVNQTRSTPAITTVTKEEIEKLANDFKRSCKDYRINLKECDADRAVVGTSVIRFYFKLARGQALPALRNQLEDIGREMRRTGVLVQTIQNSDELILDVPRLQREQVLYSDVLAKLPPVTSPEQLFFPLGRTPDGKDIIKDLNVLPHLLVGGSTGSGKTVFLFTMLATFLKTHPTAGELQLVLSSSGLEDFIHFDGIPHLFNGRVLSDAAETAEVIQGVVFKEFSRREKILADARVANIDQYNEKHVDKLAPMVVVIDEFADLTDQFTKKRDKEAFFTPVRQIAQIGRKRGIHLVLCTQRPAADLVPSNIKAQLNGRLALRVNDSNSSRMILEEMGAQQLQKHGDMIYKNGAEIERAQGYYISIEEIEAIIKALPNK